MVESWNYVRALPAPAFHYSIQLLALDRVLARYGSETGEIRKGLQRAVGARIDMIWGHGSSKPANLDPMSSGVGLDAERLADAVRGLKPRDDSQRAFQARALDLAEAVLQGRWLATAGTGSSIPMPFLAVLLFWLTITFTSFGLFAPFNATVVGSLFVAALSVSGAIFLIFEMYSPYTGVIQVSSAPLRAALALLGQ